ncbi:MAG TPA: hypothetical protein ENK14_08860 [Caldithrix sp.]|nr:hypothetical protein [Caldithrix sp.]
MKRIAWAVLAVVLIFAMGCSKSEKEAKLEKAAKQMEQASKQMEEASKQMSKGLSEGAENLGEAMKNMGKALGADSKVEPVNFRELKKLLPDELPGMKRVNASGEKTASFGIKVATAEATYRGDDGSRITIKITDMGNMSGYAAMAAYAWTMAEIDRESDNGYERTTEYAGHKAFEEYNSRSKSGEIQVLVAKRFIVEVEGSEVKMDDVKNAVKKIQLDKLEKLAPKKSGE